MVGELPVNNPCGPREFSPGRPREVKSNAVWVPSRVVTGPCAPSRDWLSKGKPSGLPPVPQPAVKESLIPGQPPSSSLFHRGAGSEGAANCHKVKRLRAWLCSSRPLTQDPAAHSSPSGSCTSSSGIRHPWAEATSDLALCSILQGPRAEV